MNKRKLSYLQIAYKEFFLNMLSNYGVNSPAKLDYDQKREFFTRIKQEWGIEKAKLTKPKTTKRPRTRKETYSKVKVSRPSIKIAPAKTKKPESDVISGEDPAKLIISKANPAQTENLKINFHPNDFFSQDDPYSYPVVKMPKENSLLKLPRVGRAMGKGFKEEEFYQAIRRNIPEVEVIVNLHMAIPNYNRPYEPDIVLIDKRLNLYVDIEIDEPYDGYYRYPTHEIDKDDIRDLFFIESGWIVIRFTERQVHKQEAECIAYIKDVLNSIYKFTLEESSNCVSEDQWDYQKAVRWQKSHYREKYLGIESFGKQEMRSEIIVDHDSIDLIEKKLSRTRKFKTEFLQDNIAFEDESHIYHHPQDETGNAQYISVTTLIDRFFPFDMDRFIQSKAKREKRTEEDVLEEFRKNRDEAAEKGTYLHEQIEHFLKGEDYDDSFKEFDLFSMFFKEIVEAKGFEFVEAEKRILLEKHNLAGTVDALFKKPNKDEYLIVDWKRSKKLVVDGFPKIYGFGFALSELGHLDNSSFYKYALQQNLYKHILETEYNMSISSMNLIVLHEKYDEYYRVNLPNMEKEIEIILNSINHKI